MRERAHPYSRDAKGTRDADIRVADTQGAKDGKVTKEIGYRASSRDLRVDERTQARRVRSADISSFFVRQPRKGLAASVASVAPVGSPASPLSLIGEPQHSGSIQASQQGGGRSLSTGAGSVPAAPRAETSCRSIGLSKDAGKLLRQVAGTTPITTPLRQSNAMPSPAHVFKDPPRPESLSRPPSTSAGSMHQKLTRIEPRRSDVQVSRPTSLTDAQTSRPSSIASAMSLDQLSHASTRPLRADSSLRSSTTSAMSIDQPPGVSDVTRSSIPFEYTSRQFEEALDAATATPEERSEERKRRIYSISTFRNAKSS